MARRLGILFQTAGRVSSVKQLASRSIYMAPPPISSFQPQEGYADRAKQFYEFEEVSKDVFKTSNLSSSRQGSHKAAYGGLIFSQAMAAAENTVSSDLKPHAIHSFFILNVDTSIPVEYTVRRSRDGKSFCTRSVEAIQNEKVAFTMEISFHKIEPDAVIHQAEMPNVSHWSELACTREAVPWIKDKVEKENIELPKSVQWSLYQYDSRASGQGDLFEIRPTDIYKHYGLSSDTSTKTFYHWFRAVGDLPTDEKLHRYLVAYNTDSVMAASVYRPHYVHKDFCPTMMFSLDHNIWIHEHDLKADQWLLYAVESTWAGKSRGFTKGQLFTEDGRLVLSATQECLVRSRGSVSRL